MKKVIVFIETGEDKTFNAYTNENLEFGLLGEGVSVSETIQDFKDSYSEMRAIYLEDQLVFPEYEFIFKYDIESFLSHYSKIFSMSALEGLTGINQKQLHHYKSGKQKPRQAQVEKIESALHKLGSELQAVHL